MATAGLILISSIIENSYFLAYHDELTTLPARRAFNDALLRLEAPYAVAVVDIDHFKKFNDTYGHDTGDQVLRLVAGKLAGVTGGGRAYRVGGEEFSILFPGKSAKDVMPHLDLLRTVIEVATFRVRGGEERRSTARGQKSRASESRAGDSSAGDFRNQGFKSQDSEWSGRPDSGVSQSRAAKRRTPRPVSPPSFTAKEASPNRLRDGEPTNLGYGQHRRS